MTDANAGAAISRDAARRLIVELRLPAVVLDVFDGNDVPAPLDVMLGCPTEYFMLDAAGQVVYASDRLVPILDDGNFGSVLAYDLQRSGFVWFLVEERVQPDELPCRSWVEIVAALLVSMWEAEVTDERMRAIALLFEFKPIDLLLDACRGGTGGTFGEHDAFLESLLSRLRVSDA